MSTLREQFSAARKSQVEIQLDVVRNIASNVVDSAGKVAALNLSTGRQSIAQSAETLRKLVSAKSPRDLADLSQQSQSGFDALLNYGSELFNIASRAQADLIRAAAPAAIAPTPALRALPGAEVEVEVQAEAPAGAALIDVVDEVPLPAGEVKADPLAAAVSQAVGQAEAPVLEASPLVTAAPEEVTISGIEPVEATPPHAQAAQDRPEAPAPKARRKK